METDVAAQPRTAKGEATTTEPTRTEQAVARRLAESAATIPTATVEALASLPGDASAPLRYAVLRAFARALAEHPRANGAWRDARFERWSRVNVALVVPTAEGLVAPTLFDADGKDAAQLAQEGAELEAAAHAGTLTSPQLSGATASLWTVEGADRAAAPVTPGHAVALTVGDPRGGDRVWLTLSCDQRVLPVPVAAPLLGRVVALLG